MIIVSQDKEIIINFDNATSMTIGYNGKFVIRAEDDNKVYEMGEYKTKERAKEVLQEIIRYYAIANIGQVYEMPED